MAIKTTENIQYRVQLYTILAIFLMAVLIATCTIYPLYSNLRKNAQHDLIFARDMGVLIVDEYLSRINEIAKQISSRTKARMLLEAYNKGEMNHSQVSAELNVILNSALKSNDQLIAITRLSNQGKIIASAGKSMPKSFWPKNFNQHSLSLYGPIIKNKHYYIFLVAPIFNADDKKIGSDISVYDITNLQAIIRQKIQYRLGDVLIIHFKNNALHSLFPTRSWSSQMNTNTLLGKSLRSMINKKSIGLVSGRLDKKNIFIAYAPVNQPGWGVAAITSQELLLAPIQKILWIILATIIFVTLIFIFGLNLCLKPLSGKIILRTHELEEEIERSQSKLKEANYKLQHIADHDFLTNLLNRRGFNIIITKEIARAKRYKTPFTLFYIDLNGFKKINDTKGHKTGDAVLKAFSDRLKLAVRESDTIARIGGDEFSIIAPKLTQDHIATVITKIYETGKMSIECNGVLINCSVSIGYAIYPEDGEDIDSLLACADQRMYKDKFPSN